jgi:hypothetical protein
MRRLSVILLVGAALVGCQGQDASLSKQDTKTLETNLNTPVDYEKIRDDYYKKQGKTPPPAGPGGGSAPATE